MDYEAPPRLHLKIAPTAAEKTGLSRYGLDKGGKRKSLALAEMTDQSIFENRPLGDIARDSSFRAMNAVLTQGSPFASQKESTA